VRPQGVTEHDVGAVVVQVADHADRDLTGGVAHGEPGIEGLVGILVDDLDLAAQRPQLAVAGTVDGEAVTGRAWLDHEWSSQYLAPEAAGWDWVGLNLEGGRSLMAFRIRDKQGGVHFAPPGVSFAPRRTWRSPRTDVEYPVAMRVEANGQAYDLEPLMDDQELDARRSTGIIYWEGAVRALQSGKEAGRGYLELTGYWRPMEL